MSKAKSSKLDQFAEPLADLERERKTLAEMIIWLKAEGCSVSASRLSSFLEAQRSARAQEKMLDQITSGARAVREVRDALGKNPPPELELLISLHRTLIFKLSTQASVDPAMIELVTSLMKPVMEWAKLQEKQKDREFEQEKFQFNACAAALKCLPQLKAIAGNKALNEDERLEQARLALFGSAPK